MKSSLWKAKNKAMNHRGHGEHRVRLNRVILENILKFNSVYSVNSVVKDGVPL